MLLVRGRARLTFVPWCIRTYVRDPQQAIEAASTVRGQRLERQRLEQLSSEASRRSTSRTSTWRRAWKTWRDTPLKWSPLPIAVGASVLVAVQAHRVYVEQCRREADDSSPVIDGAKKPVRTSGPWSLYILGALPLNSISRTWGWLNSLPLPIWFRPYGFRLYAWLFGCHLDEMRETDLTKYASLAEFFARELKPGARPIDTDAALVSPADGKILHLGIVEGDRVEQVKGLTYSLRSLLGQDSTAQAEHDIHPHMSPNMSIAAEQQFARLNGIDYSLEELLGSESSSGLHRAGTYAMGWIRSPWRWLKHMLTGTPSRAQETLPIHQVTQAELAADNQEQETRDAEEQDVGIPTSDTPKNLGHYANIAYEMGTQAIPPFQQQQGWSPAPGHHLYFCVIYLAPGDYHRFHSPVPWVVEMRRHFRGELYSVSPYVATRLPNLFLLNERVALLGRWRHGVFSMTPIGATNVGSIQIHFDRLLRTNLHDERKFTGTYAQATYNAASRILGGQPLATGDEMGSFLLGSTIVLVFEAPEQFHFVRRSGEHIKVGEALGRVVSE